MATPPPRLTARPTSNRLATANDAKAEPKSAKKRKRKSSWLPQPSPRTTAAATSTTTQADDDANRSSKPYESASRAKRRERRDEAIARTTDALFRDVRPGRWAQKQRPGRDSLLGLPGSRGASESASLPSRMSSPELGGGTEAASSTDVGSEGSVLPETEGKGGDLPGDEGGSSPELGARVDGRGSDHGGRGLPVRSLGSSLPELGSESSDLPKTEAEGGEMSEAERSSPELDARFDGARDVRDSVANAHGKSGRSLKAERASSSPESESMAEVHTSPELGSSPELGTAVDGVKQNVRDRGEASKPRRSKKREKTLPLPRAESSPESDSAPGPVSGPESASGLDGADDRVKRPSTHSKKVRPRKTEEAPLPNRRYVELLNQTIAEANGSVLQPDLVDDFGQAHVWNRPSQFGLTVWSGEEKTRLFNALGRVGQHNVARIASMVGTKSALEVAQYINIFQTAIEDDVVASHWFRHHIVPTAAEIPAETCEAMEDEADRVLDYQASQDVAIERRKFGSYWLLGNKTARRLEKLVGGSRLDAQATLSMQMNQNTRTLLVPAVTLLRLPVWLDLSAHFFMNGSAPSIDHADDETPDPPPAGVHKSHPSRFQPALLATALTDFHNLAVSVTRRLVAASLFQASTRLRGTDLLPRSAAPNVTADDVATAVDVLGLQHDSLAFWARTARKCRLDVYDYTPAQRRWPLLYGVDVARVARSGGLGERMRYSAVERALGLDVPSSSSEDEGESDASPTRSPSRSSSRSPSRSLGSAPSSHSPSPLPSLQGRDSSSPASESDHFPSASATHLSHILRNTTPPPFTPSYTHPHSRPRRPDSPPTWPSRTSRTAEWERDGFAELRRRHASELDAGLREKIRRKWRRSVSRSGSRGRKHRRDDDDSDDDGDAMQGVERDGAPAASEDRSDDDSDDVDAMAIDTIERSDAISESDAGSDMSSRGGGRSHGHGGGRGRGRGRGRGKDRERGRGQTPRPPPPPPPRRNEPRATRSRSASVEIAGYAGLGAGSAVVGHEDESDGDEYAPDMESE